ncbi:ribonuclease III [Arcanobacterium hippocoleae]|uniref:ribonuclease III n=1 Tax=Arcanobacterium hippocoleae TaxID=149017 RepID=UPI00333F0FC7
MQIHKNAEPTGKYANLLAAWGKEIPLAGLEHALTHRSWAYEHDAKHNERLEFLGDSVLGIITVEEIFRTFPDSDEGTMSKIKAASVSEAALAIVARELELGKYIRLGKGEAASGGANKDSILSDTVEALIAVTYLYYGIDVTREIVLRFIRPRIESALQHGPALDWRTSFEELARAKGISGDLTYQLHGSGPDHARVYTAEVFWVGDPSAVVVHLRRKTRNLRLVKRLMKI